MMDKARLRKILAARKAKDAREAKETQSPTYGDVKEAILETKAKHLDLAWWRHYEGEKKWLPAEEFLRMLTTKEILDERITVLHGRAAYHGLGISVKGSRVKRVVLVCGDLINIQYIRKPVALAKWGWVIFEVDFDDYVKAKQLVGDVEYVSYGDIPESILDFVESLGEMVDAVLNWEEHLSKEARRLLRRHASCSLIVPMG